MSMKHWRMSEDYKALIAKVSDLLYEADPIGIGEIIGAPRDEYDSEARKVVPALRDASSIEELTWHIHNIFIDQFSEAAAGEVSKYQSIARQVWNFKQLTKNW